MDNLIAVEFKVPSPRKRARVSLTEFFMNYH